MLELRPLAPDDTAETQSPRGRADTDTAVETQSTQRKASDADKARVLRENAKALYGLP